MACDVSPVAMFSQDIAAAAVIVMMWDGQCLRLELPIAWNRALGVIGNGSRRTTIHQLLGLS